MAAVTIDTAYFEIYEGTTYIVINDQTADFFNVSTEDHYVDISLNGTNINFTTSTNKTLTGITYLDDILEFIATGAGTLTINATMSNALTRYGLFENGIQQDSDETDESGHADLEFTLGSGTYYFTIKEPQIIVNSRGTGSSSFQRPTIVTSSGSNASGGAGRTVSPKSIITESTVNALLFFGITLLLSIGVLVYIIIKQKLYRNIMKLRHVEK